eukprot:CAMPEP_0118988426 /NCGR_PEP_ID=MMETSP1173-20130426/46195_1 /TAXON_ID=1034831 /ORGANISM="Rhizochromulina marina cf, Strain CCMP1243" /LENGTH=123 /DNA_ID=CAMNT_0006939355 /DNA_START=581 /DNA_END=949 /DNA_ORIENTATION=-
MVREGKISQISNRKGQFIACFALVGAKAHSPVAMDEVYKGLALGLHLFHRALKDNYGHSQLVHSQMRMESSQPGLCQTGRPRPNPGSGWLEVVAKTELGVVHEPCRAWLPARTKGSNLFHKAH